jgi:retron-type reverse transcriptase
MSLSIDIIRALGWSGTDIQRIVSTAPARYKVYPIPKRHGAGWRIIAQPSRELKAIQHYILHNKLTAYPVHESAMAYALKRNIRANAERHIAANVVLKLDFTDFFPSIKVADWEKYARRVVVDAVDPSDIKLYSRIMFWGETPRSVLPRCLSIGAPTSPALSNILLYDLDVTLAEAALKLNVQYTRYADDITISGPTTDAVLRFETIASKAIRSLKSPKLVFNEEKRGLYKKGQRRMVTGLIITPTRQISIGRERKRLISAMLHRSSRNLLNLLERSRLKGLLGFSVANEPQFVGRLREKYGNEVIDAALTFHAPLRQELAQFVVQ